MRKRCSSATRLDSKGEIEMMRHANNVRHRSPDTVEVLKEDIATIRRDLAALLGEKVSRVSDRTRELMEETSERARVVHQRVGEFAGERPITTIAMAAVAGALGFKILGWMFRRGMAP
jgi:ElaB/YqjD/DUF883 family membrane-anchored ribosome-binding protein